MNITVTLGGLTSDQQDQVQWWTNDSANLMPIFDGGFNPLINALQVRAVPEPSVTLLGLATAAAGAAAWRRRSAAFARR